MGDLPQGLDRERHGELTGRPIEPWARRAILLVVLAGAIAALAGVFGQRESTSEAAGPAGLLTLRAPDTVRGGLLFQARIEVTAVRTMEHPRLVLDEGWMEGLQINTIEPSPSSEASRDGRLVLSYDQGLDPGDRLVVYVQFQVDPTSSGRTENDVALDDGDTPVARIDHTLRRFP